MLACRPTILQSPQGSDDHVSTLVVLQSSDWAPPAAPRLFLREPAPKMVPFAG